ncbi:DUF4912 domain-containing protein [filamentous cyanobacterium LEGE 11480]|uniref:DUF4912 domain-containing protein n=1 Tax=Romeriopsis navalis LEGE 11480 TaxID=2777977 RepID=A0A928VLC8_9CYAN|nr:DUF4912 domain-containing protein [Romeriopsis navalis]MBE9028645.1 DUF4912 domain-containing protein [Romeriopsis navalis LEGE 11480]
MLKKKNAPIVTLAMLLLLAATPYIGFRGFKSLEFAPVQAQTAQSQFTVPDSVAADTTVRIAASEPTSTLSAKLKQGFEQRYQGTEVLVAAENADVALQSVAEGRADVAVIGRALSDGERAQGLTPVTIGRQKIAVITSPDNPVGNLTNAQFAQIFRGEITNWSAVGGDDVPIRLIDQTLASGTRQSLSNYPVFQAAPFEAANGAFGLTRNDIDSIVAQLGNDGIAYVIADQALGRSDLKIVPLHQVLPDDARYSFSQPLSYVYQGPNPNAAAQAFLGYATGADGQQLANLPPIATAAGTATGAGNESSGAGGTSAAGTSGAGAAAGAIADTNQSNRQVPQGWGLLLLPLLGLPLLAFWMKGRKRDAKPVTGGGAPTTARPITAATSPSAFRGGTPVTGLGAGAVAGAAGLGAAGVAGAAKAAGMAQDRAADAADTVKAKMTGDTAVSPSRTEMPASKPQLDQSPSGKPQKSVALPSINTAGIAGVGLAGAGMAAGLVGLGRNQDKAQDQMTPDAAHQPPTNLPIDEAHHRSRQAHDGRIIVVPRDESTAYAYWEVPPGELQDCPAGKRLNLRLYDVTGTTEQDGLPPNYKQFDCAQTDCEMNVPLSGVDRDYVAELGYTSDAGRWISLGHSQRTHISQTDAANAHQARTTTLMGAFESPVQPVGQTEDKAADQSRLVITSTMPAWSAVGTPTSNEPRVYVSWDILAAQQARRSGKQMVLRVYDATNIDLDRQAAHSFRQYLISDTAKDMVVSVPAIDRDYVAEIGYLLPDGQLERVIRSTHTHVPVVAER